MYVQNFSVYTFFHFPGINAQVLFNLLRKCQTVFQRGCAILQSYQQCWSVPLFPHWILMMWITSVAVQNLWLAAQLESDIMPTFPFLVTEVGNPCDIKGRQKEVSPGAVISEMFIFASFPQIICICLVMGPDLSASQALSVHWLTKCVWYLPSQIPFTLRFK